MKKLRLDVSDVDIKNAFKAFDLNREDQIQYEEFVKVIIGPMSPYRVNVVEKAFDKLDIN